MVGIEESSQPRRNTERTNDSGSSCTMFAMNSKNTGADSAPVALPFSPDATAAEVVAGVDLSGRRMVVTGGASGIGLETVRALAGAGAEVTIATRNLAAAEQVAEELTAATGNKVRAARVDLTDLATVAAFAAEWTGPLHVLVNNAGVMMPPETRTEHGWELQFAANHLGHAALTFALRDALAEAGGARIVSVSSSAHLLAGIEWDDIHFQQRAYNPLLGYAQSKTANALFAVAVTDRWSADGITANAVHPGVIPTTGLQRHIVRPPEEVAKIKAAAQSQAAMQVDMKTPEQGAATTVVVATSPLLDGVGGRYFEDCREGTPNQPGERSGYAPWALDRELADRLWATTEAHLAAAG